jgi:hypothetical protein
MFIAQYELSLINSFSASWQCRDSKTILLALFVYLSVFHSVRQQRAGQQQKDAKIGKPLEAQRSLSLVW